MRNIPRGLCAAIITLAFSLAAPAVADTGVDWETQPMLERNLPVVFDVDPALETHTIVRPAELEAVDFAMPVMLWENGSCSWENSPYHAFLSRIAASGVIVLAKGGAAQHMESPRPPGTDVYFEYVEQMKDMQLAALDWLLAQDADPSSSLYGKVDESRVVAMGYSCGAFPAVENAARDPRIKSILFFNSGVRPGLSDEDFLDVVSPIAAGTPIGIVDGGEADMAARSGQDTFNRMPAHLPVFFANWQGVGHTGFWTGDNAADFQPQLAQLAINWIDYTLVSGRASAREAIMGKDCQLCSVPEVTLEVKNWEAFAAPSGPPGEPLRRN